MYNLERNFIGLPEGKCHTCTLPDCLIKKYCSPQELEFLDEQKTTLLFRKGQNIFQEGSNVTGVYFIYQGKVKVYKTGPFGKEQIVRFSKDGDIVGHRGLGRNSRYPVSACTLEDSIISYIEKDVFFEMLQKNASLTFHLLLFFADELRHAEEQLNKLSQLSVRGRVADALLMLRAAYGSVAGTNALSVILSRQGIADISGTTKEQVSKYLSEFKTDELIDLNGKEIFVLNVGKLSEVK